MSSHTNFYDVGKCSRGIATAQRISVIRLSHVSSSNLKLFKVSASVHAFVIVQPYPERADDCNIVSSPTLPCPTFVHHFSRHACEHIDTRDGRWDRQL